MTDENVKYIQLTTLPTDTEIDQLKLFKSRFQELWLNWEDLKRDGVSLSGNFELGADGRLHGGDIGVSRFRVKGFLVDFRYFTLQKEPTHAPKVANLIKKLCRDDQLHLVVNEDKKRWNGAKTLCGWHNFFSPTDVLNALFNEVVFHSSQTNPSMIGLSTVQSKMHSQVIWWEVLNIAYLRMLVVRNFVWILDPYYNGACELRIPKNGISE